METRAQRGCGGRASPGDQLLFLWGLGKTVPLLHPIVLSLASEAQEGTNGGSLVRQLHLFYQPELHGLHLWALLGAPHTLLPGGQSPVLGPLVCGLHPLSVLTGPLSPPAPMGEPLAGAGGAHAISKVPRSGRTRASDPGRQTARSTAWMWV